MKYLRTYILALVFFLSSWVSAHAVEPLSPGQKTAKPQTPDLALIVIFTDVVWIHAGATASLTDLSQAIAFQVVPKRLIDFINNEELPVGGPIVIAVENQAFAKKEPSQYIQTCLNLIRELLVNENTGLEMTLHLRVRSVGGDYIVNEFVGCGLDPIGA
jgi:hypothetical protein